MRPRKVLAIGSRFTRLVVEREASPGIYVCKCDCGTVRQIPRNNLTSGNTKSCGCLNRELAAERLKLARKKRHALP